MVTDKGILICDFGSQYTLLIARKLRELGFYSELCEGSSETGPDLNHVAGIILSGGPDGVHEEGARKLPPWVKASGLPLLGICYGMQLMASESGARLKSGQHKEFGKARITLASGLLSSCGRVLTGANLPASQTVWMSHGDHVESLSDDFEILATSDTGIISGICHKSRPWLGLQFHPEVHHTEHGQEILEIFASDICGLEKTWQSTTMCEEAIGQIRNQVNPGDKVLLAVSGGVDSSAASLVLTRALGQERVVCIYIDHGMMRKDETKQVREMFDELGMNLKVLDQKDRFLSALKGVSDPEEKRKIIGQTFISSFEEFASSESGFTHLGQGTLYPDVIESAGHGAGAKVIKSHHNVGGLPEKLALKLLEPFRFLFKDEVRRIGKELGLSEEMTERHPFPGPGLAVRIPGEVSAEKIAILQEADAVFIEALKASGFYDKVWQAATILLPVKSVGVMGDKRTYQWTCVLRAVTGVDAMTAEAADLPLNFLSKVSSDIVQKVDGVNRVLYDVTSKPPATIEWE